jgi:deoxyadenosine/deoxycytidine kinase
MIIWVSGPTGSGKTTLTRSLRASGFSIVEENIPEELFRAFISAPKEYCEKLQRQIMQARFDGWRRVCGTARIAFDRSIDEDIEVFCKMHWQAGRLTEEQFWTLSEFGRGLLGQIPGPDLIFFITSDQQVLFERMQRLSSPSLMLEGLKDQISLYAEWLQNRTGEIAEFDTTQLSEATLAQFFLEIGPC